MVSAPAYGEAELGLRHWASLGTTQWSHNAQPWLPALGNPSSILTYDDVGANSLELHGRLPLGERWFLKGNVGLGRLIRGSLDDEDYLAGQVKFSDSTSSVQGDEISYATLDVGRTVWKSDGGDWLAVFAGWNGWRETAHAYGAEFTAGGAPPVPRDVLIIANEVMWDSLRLGLAARFQGSHRLRANAEIAFIPYARLRNEDSHFLRQDPADLGAVPNVINEGSGYGVQAEAEVRWAFHRSFELGLGVRYWWLKTDDGNSRNRAGTFDLVLQESERIGVTLSLTSRW